MTPARCANLLRGNGTMKDYQSRRPARKTEETASPIPENLVCGRNEMRELLADGKTIDKVFVERGEHAGSIGSLLEEVRNRKIPVVTVDRARLDAMTGGARHQGIAAMVAEHAYATIEDLLAVAAARGEPPFLLICDGVEDPHNLGAIIRSAECMGAHGIIIPKRRSVGLTPVVAKASAGAIEHLPIARVTNLVAAMEQLKEAGLWIYAADMDGSPYDAADLTGAVALVVGNEGSGISRLVREKCDFVLSIPQYGCVNSLNVSNAAAILACEIARQRHRR